MRGRTSSGSRSTRAPHGCTRLQRRLVAAGSGRFERLAVATGSGRFERHAVAAVAGGSKSVLALLAGALLAACAPHPSGGGEHRAVAGGDPRAAPAAFREYGCGSCHTIPGVRGADSLVGPPLTGFAARRFIAGRLPNEPEMLVRWILDPQEVKPGTAMPDVGVTGEKALDMAAYLYTLR